MFLPSAPALQASAAAQNDEARMTNDEIRGRDSAFVIRHSNAGQKNGDRTFARSPFKIVP
jgi:hypothetical protein